MARKILSIDQALARARSHAHKGELDQARELYQAVLEAFPKNQQAIAGLKALPSDGGKHPAPQFTKAQLDGAIALYSEGRLQEAMSAVQDLISRDTNVPILHNLAGAIHADSGRLDLAVESYRRALKISPDYAEAYNNLGNALSRSGEYEEAAANYRRALEINLDYAEAYNNLGDCLRKLGKGDEAIASYHRALKIKPDFAEAYNNLGVALSSLGKYEDAAASIRRAIEIKPDYAEAHNNLGNALTDLNNHEEAAASYHKALQIRPDYAEAHNNLGIVLIDLGKPDEARLHYESALKIKPNYAKAHNNLGMALKYLGKHEEAVASYAKALQIKPNYAEAHNNLGVALNALGKHREAIASYRKALAVNPGLARAQGNIIYTLRLMDEATSAEIRAAADKFGQIVRSGAKPYTDWNVRYDPAKKLRVGMVSADFRTHVVARFLKSFLGHIDRTQFELVAYSNSAKEDETTAQLKPHFARWKKVQKLDDETLAGQIHNDAVDILIDLSSHTAGNRLPIFALKPAPVQATWLGLFVTSGVPGMDYIIAAPYLVTDDEAQYFTEEVWPLAETWFCLSPPDVTIEPSSPPALTTGTFTFGSFNNLSKMTDAVVALWARILLAVPDSRLFLKTWQLRDELVRQKTLARFGAHGIGSDRLVLEGSSPPAGYFAAYNRVDVSLDPFPFAGATTTLDGLWMGVPVLTRRGERMGSHLGESIAQAAGLGDWIADDDEDYIKKAVAATSDLRRLAALRAGLRDRVMISPLYDGARFAHHFTDALRQMWRKQCIDPQAIAGLKALPSDGGKHPAPQFTKAQLDGAIALYSEGRLQEAMSAVQDLISRDSNVPILHNLAGAIHADSARLDLAVESYRRALQINPDYAEAYNNLGNALSRSGEYEEAAANYRRALEIDPDYAEAHNNLGITLCILGKYSEATNIFLRALENNPDDAIAHYNLGNALKDLDKFGEATVAYRRALEIKPDFAEAHNNLASALSSLGRNEEAAASYQAALSINPDYAEALYNLGNTQKDLGQNEKAIASYYRAIKLKPDYAGAYNNLGNALKNVGKHEEAVTCFLKALEIDPMSPSFHCNLAYTMLSVGDFERGWSEYEWRWQEDQQKHSRRDFVQPLWLGKASLESRTILLHCEQGFGDAIQFSRYAKLVADQGARVVLEAPKALMDVMGTLDRVAHLVEKRSALPDFDYHCPLLSLPLAFHTDLSSIPNSTPYLFSDANLLAAWRNNLGAPTKLRVGLVWSGSVGHPNDRTRTITLTNLLPLLREDVEWISLQKEVREYDADLLATRNDVIHLGDQLKDFSDTAALIEIMDLVVTVDTSVAHLAGAMGKPVWILLPFNPDWRWLLDREDSPWYPTARLFRQPVIGDWASVIARVNSELSILVERK